MFKKLLLGGILTHLFFINPAYSYEITGIEPLDKFVEIVGFSEACKYEVTQKAMAKYLENTGIDITKETIPNDGGLLETRILASIRELIIESLTKPKDFDLETICPSIRKIGNDSNLISQ